MDYAIIVAGGQGLRMGGDVPKQFLPLNGLPVLMRTMQRFAEYSENLQIILVLPRSQQDYWRELCQKYSFSLPLSRSDSKSSPVGGGVEGALMGASSGALEGALADGGETRFHSVQNGLALIPDDAEGVVGIHDGVRPFVSVEVIARCYETARTAKAVVPVVPVVESLRHIHDGAVPRADYRMVQTPQVFDIQLLKRAYRQPFNDLFTDDASVVESLGHPITLVDGNRENIKITTPFDLRIAEATTKPLNRL